MVWFARRFATTFFVAFLLCIRAEECYAYITVVESEFRTSYNNVEETVVVESSYVDLDVAVNGNSAYWIWSGWLKSNTSGFLRMRGAITDFEPTAWFNFDGTLVPPSPATGSAFYLWYQIGDWQLRFPSTQFIPVDAEQLVRFRASSLSYYGPLSESIRIDFVNTLPRPGDYDDDDVVAFADFLAWKAEFGNKVRFAGSGADGNFNGIVDAADYVVWRDNFGPVSGAASELAVPEPKVFAIFVVLLASATNGRVYRMTTP